MVIIVINKKIMLLDERKCTMHDKGLKSLFLCCSLVSFYVSFFIGFKDHKKPSILLIFCSVLLKKIAH